MQSFKGSIKEIAKRALPKSLFEQIQATRSRRHQVRFLTTSGLLKQVNGYIEQHGTTVQAGPFMGMTYPRESALCRWSIPKLLGSYEKELHPFLAQAPGRHYDSVIDIGSAEGYYSTGLARLLQIPVYAFEPCRHEKHFSAEMAQTNGVSHLVKMENLFTENEMRQHSTERALVVCDCEGFESVLFRMETLDLTRNWDIIVELHHDSDQTLPKLAWPHHLTLLDIGGRSGLEDEYRGEPQRFLICEARPQAYMA